jgi:uncharacterized protein (TIGR03067 family)
LAIVACAVATVRGGDTGKDDTKDIQGKWKITKAQVDGKEVDAKNFAETRFIFKGDIITFQHPTEKNSATFGLDPRKKPRHINTVVQDGKAKGEARMGIYELSGDKLKLCWSKSTTRPADFATKEGDKFINLELERVKE